MPDVAVTTRLRRLPRYSNDASSIASGSVQNDTENLGPTGQTRSNPLVKLVRRIAADIVNEPSWCGKPAGIAVTRLPSTSSTETSVVLSPDEVPLLTAEEAEAMEAMADEEQKAEDRRRANFEVHRSARLFARE